MWGCIYSGANCICTLSILYLNNEDSSTQSAAYRRSVVLAGQVQRAAFLSLVLGVHVGASLEQQGRQLRVAVQTRNMQRREALTVSRVHIQTTRGRGSHLQGTEVIEL